ncbi:MAG: SGNH/GDSL hydrolase family protein [Sphingobacteriaceae bacterium]|nr:MAG: SGNH/GDSL hydrolase family protein [Sphingobacteriaceae bacterium]
MNPKLKNGLINTGVMTLSVLFTLLAAEWGYRIFLRSQKWKLPQNYQYHIVPSAHNIFDIKYGQTTKPNNDCFMTYVENGKVIGGITNFISNADGLDSKTTFADYNKADKKVLVFGDSFSHWNQEGATWSDLVQDKLNQNSTKKTAILNYATGAYGVLQMLDLAADKIEEQKPDLIIIALINDDLSRMRWYTKELQDDQGVNRWMLSVKPGDWFNWKFSGDYALVVPEATREWNKKQLASQDPNDAVLKKANALYARLKESSDNVHQHVPLKQWDHSFLYNRLTTGTPYKIRASSGLPRMGLTDFATDKRALDDAQRIKASGVPVMLVYLPLANEFKARKVIPLHEQFNGQHAKLLNSLEKMMDDKLYHLEQEYKGTIDKKIDLIPVDTHPNRAGLELYADILAPLVQKELDANKKK